MSYQILFKRSAIKELAALPNAEVVKVKSAIELLSDDPRPAGVKKLKNTAESLWRIRVGNYRVIYAIEDAIRIVEIRAIGDRKEIYK